MNKGHFNCWQCGRKFDTNRGTICPNCKAENAVANELIADMPWAIACYYCPRCNENMVHDYHYICSQCATEETVLNLRERIDRTYADENGPEERG